MTNNGATAGWVALVGVILSAAIKYAQDRRARKPRTTVEAEAHALTERADADVTGQWQRMYLALQEDFRERIEAAENRAASAEQRAGAAEQKAARAENTSRAMARQASLREQHVIALETAVRDLGGTVPPRPYGLDLDQ